MLRGYAQAVGSVVNRGRSTLTPQFVIPPLVQLKNAIQHSVTMINERIAEIRAPARNVSTNVFRLIAMPKPMMGHRQREHMK